MLVVEQLPSGSMEIPGGIGSSWRTINVKDEINLDQDRSTYGWLRIDVFFNYPKKFAKVWPSGIFQGFDQWQSLIEKENGTNLMFLLMRTDRISRRIFKTEEEIENSRRTIEFSTIFFCFLYFEVVWDKVKLLGGAAENAKRSHSWFLIDISEIWWCLIVIEKFPTIWMSIHDNEWE